MLECVFHPKNSGVEGTNQPDGIYEGARNGYELTPP